MSRSAVIAGLLLQILVLGPVYAQQRAADIFPETTLVYLEVPNPPELLAMVLDHPLRERIESLPAFQMALKTDGYRRFHAGRKFLEIQLGKEWRPAVESLTAGGIFVGLDPATDAGIALIRAQDAETLEHFRQKLLELTNLGKTEEEIERAKYRDLSVYNNNDESWAVVVGEWLIITNRPAAGRDVVDRLLDGTGDGLSHSETFQKALRQRPAEAAAWGFVNLQAARDAGMARKFFSGKADNPGAEMLLGGVLSVLPHAEYSAMTWTASEVSTALTLTLPFQPDWIPEEREYFFGPQATGRAPALPQTKETLLTVRTWRDFSQMWLRAGDLFPEEISDSFAEADANLSTLFAGKDFGEEILGSLSPQIGLVATRKDFSDVLPTPAIRVPQFAIVGTLRDPERMTRELRRTFQSMVGFFNVVGAMEGRPQLEMDMESIDGVQLVTTRYIPDVGDENSTRADIIYNFSPSVGFADQRFVVSSTDTLARELVVAPLPTEAPADVNTEIVLYAQVLKDVLADNREQLIAQNMLEEGNSREEAEAAIDLALEVIGYVKKLSAVLETSRNDRLNIRLGVDMDVHPEKRER